MNIETYPPTHHLSSKPLTQPAATSLLQHFLSLSESKPHLHPDALITPSGVSFSTNGGPMGGAIMHNLRRIEAGLRGEFLEPSPSPEPEENSEAQSNYRQKERGGKRKLKGGEEETEGEQSEGWQDLEEFQMEEGGVQVGEVGKRSNVVEAGDEEVEETGKRRRGETKVDKEARKKAKKEKMKRERVEREKKKAGKE